MNKEKDELAERYYAIIEKAIKGYTWIDYGINLKKAENFIKTGSYYE